jgi:hypothetical protein
MQGVDGHHCVKRGTLGRPVLKRRGHHCGRREPGQPPAGDSGQLGTQLDGGDGQPALGEWHGRLTGATADLEHPVSRLEPGQVEVVEQLGRADRPGALVVLRQPTPGAVIAAARKNERDDHRWIISVSTG